MNYPFYALPQCRCVAVGGEVAPKVHMPTPTPNTPLREGMASRIPTVQLTLQIVF